MGCPVLTQERIDLLLKGALPAAERPILLAHLSEPCDDCLDVLASPSNGRLLARVAGKLLSPEESERIFAAAVASASGDRKRRSPHWSRRAWAGLVAASALAAGLTVVSLRQSHRREEEQAVANAPTAVKRSVWPATNERAKGGSPVFGTVEATLLAAEPGRPESLRVVPPGGEIGLREVVLFRVRLGESGYVTLLALSGNRSPPLPLWPDGASERHGPGEFEVASAGNALSFDLRKLGIPGPSIHVAAIASRRPLSPMHLASLPSDPQSLSVALPDAVVVIVEATLEASPD
jgi:hypothetical protein